MTNRLLAVDDESGNLNLIRRLFVPAGHDLFFASTGEQALRVLPVVKPDLVILDIRMPGLDGYDVCRRIKADGDTKDVMVLLLSARSAVSDRLRGYAVEADDFIAKPFEPDELQAKVTILLRLKNALDDLRTLNRDLENQVRRRTQEIIEKERQAVIGSMLCGIAHNMRGPLMAARGHTELIERVLRKRALGSSPPFAAVSLDEEDVKMAAASHEVILRAIDTAGDMLDNLLAKSRNEAGGEPREIDINDLIRAEMQFLEADLDMKHNVAKELQLDPKLPSIMGVYSDFSQLVFNMVNNAADAVHGSPVRRLSIATAYQDGLIQIRFRDTGVGIAEKNLEKIFDPFFTTKPAPGNGDSGKPRGTGLGLYTCRQIVQSYGGKIDVTSEPGSGTVITVHLPIGPPS